jgi:hypothetical protein
MSSYPDQSISFLLTVQVCHPTWREMTSCHWEFPIKTFTEFTVGFQALYSQTPMRKNLLVWEFESLDVKILADESYHGKVKAVEMMSKLNSERYT